MNTCEDADESSLTAVLPSSVVYALDLAAMASCTDAPSGAVSTLGASTVRMPEAEYDEDILSTCTPSGILNSFV